MEVWKSIEGYENYQVSNLGNVRNLNYNGTKGNAKPLYPKRTIAEDFGLNYGRMEGARYF